MAGTAASDTEHLVEKYLEEGDWDEKRAHVQNTSKAVRKLVQAIVDSGSIDEYAMRTIYNLCQNDNAFSPGEKKSRVENLDISSEVKADIKDRIDRGTGIVGKGTYSVPIADYESETFEFLATAIRNDDRDSIDPAIEEYASLGIDGVQNGIVSVILYFLHPTQYPISNRRSRTGMQQYFNFDTSRYLSDYLNDIEKFYAVRSDYPFHDDFRHLDSFFNWVASESEYWNKIDHRQETATAFLNNPSEETLRTFFNALPWFISRKTDSHVEQICSETTPEAVANTLREAVESGAIGPVLDIPKFGMAKASEALAAIDPEQYAPLHTRMTSAIELFFENPPNPTTTGTEGYQTYLSELEAISQQYDFLQYAEDAPHWATDYQIITRVFLRHHDEEIDLKELPGPTEDRSYYWVNQNRNVELQGEYLRSQDTKWQRDLTVLEPGDIVFHYSDQAIRACSVVTSQAYQTEMDGGEYYRVDLTTEQVDQPLGIHAIKEGLEERKQEKNRYPIDKNGDVIQAYLCHLTPEAGMYLLSEANIEPPEPDPTPEETSYFWATANPSIWSVDEIDDGSEVFYSAYNDRGNKKRLFDAFQSATPGDRVLFYESTPVKAVVAEGTITEGLGDQPTAEGSESQDTHAASEGIRIQFDRAIKGITWNDLQGIPDLGDAAPIINGAQGSLFPLTEDEYETILAVEPTQGDVPQDAIDDLAAKLTTPNIDVSIPPGLYFDDPDRLQREIEASLRSGKHIILTGPPGTGKTKLAKAICQSATTTEQVDDYRFTTATSEWTAFDTIGGYVPSTNDGGEQLQFEPRLFLKCFRQDRIINEWLIIDEINRSDIDKAFGQLFSVLSGDSTELPYERERTVELHALTSTATEEELASIIENPDAFPITPSWRLIATMNTYDKTSLYEMSYAFMRRFNFIHVGVPPLTSDDGVRTSLLNPDANANYATAWLSDDDTLRPILENTYQEIAVLWERINNHRVIGPSIVYDIIRYLDAYNDPADAKTDALTSAVISLVYPQLEGMRPEQQKQLIQSLNATDVDTEAGTIDLHLDAGHLKGKASDFFGITFDDDS